MTAIVKRRWWVLGGLSVFLLALWTLGRIPAATYHDRQPAARLCVQSEANACASETLYVVGDRHAPNPPLMAIVEFEDAGKIREPALFEGLMSDLASRAKHRPLLVLVFAHGWRHNASADDSNLSDFTRVVARLGQADRERCAGQSCGGRQVVGVYFGWRGLSNRFEPFTTLTFWKRKAVAHRVGRDGASQVVARLRAITGPNHQGESDGALITVGHSFGGALIFESLAQGLADDLRQSTASGSISRRSVDTAILVNPAFEAARFDDLRMLGRMNPTPGQAPLLAAFTSESDDATAGAFPIGRWFSHGWKDDERDDDIHLDKRKRNLTAVGHFQRFWTHSLGYAPDPERETAGSAWSGGPCQFILFTQKRSNLVKSGKVWLSRLAADEPDRYESPLWIVRVDTQLIEDHSRIWNSDFASFVYYLVLQASSEKRDGCPRDGLIE